MEKIPIFNNLNVATTRNITPTVGMLELNDDSNQKICFLISQHFKEYGKIPTLHLDYSFSPNLDETTGKILTMSISVDPHV